VLVQLHQRGEDVGVGNRVFAAILLQVMGADGHAPVATGVRAALLAVHVGHAAEENGLRTEFAGTPGDLINIGQEVFRGLPGIVDRVHEAGPVRPLLGDARPPARLDGVVGALEVLDRRLDDPQADLALCLVAHLDPVDGVLVGPQPHLLSGVRARVPPHAAAADLALALADGCGSALRLEQQVVGVRAADCGVDDPQWQQAGDQLRVVHGAHSAAGLRVAGEDDARHEVGIDGHGFGLSGGGHEHRPGEAGYEQHANLPKSRIGGYQAAVTTSASPVPMVTGSSNSSVRFLPAFFTLHATSRRPSFAVTDAPGSKASVRVWISSVP